MSENCDSLEFRLDRLERSNNRLRWLLLGVPLVILIMGAQAQQSVWKGKTVTAEEFVLTDSDGKYRAGLKLENGDANLVLTDKEQNVRIRLSADPDGRGPALFLVNAKHKVVATLRTDKSADGKGLDGGKLYLLDEDEKVFFSAFRSINKYGCIDFYKEGVWKGGNGGTAFDK
jgi:hypothetical protein